MRKIFKNNNIHITCGHFTALFIRLAIVLLFYFISRLLFLAFNANYYITENDSGGFEYWFNLFLGGFRFDLYVICILNSLYIIATLLPFKFRENPLYIKYTKIFLFYIPNILGFLVNYVDIIYSRFTHKRMTFDVFRFIETGDGFIDLLPDFLKDFWYIFLIFVFMMAIFIILNQIIKVKYNDKIYSIKTYFFKNIIQFFVVIVLCFIGARGGVQLRPISIVTASHYANPRHYSLVLNTPFTLMKTMFYDGLERKKYFSDEEIMEIYQPLYLPERNKKLVTDNIIVIILESFSLEYSAILNPDSEVNNTPTLDSIGRLGVMLPAYANGVRSMEGIPAVLASIPTLMNNEYITSNYAENQITSLPNLLKKYGYKSAFFHGGKNGTLNFNSFTKVAGFDYYYGKNEYNNNADYDGSWGIYDDRFFEYFVKQLDTISEPFFSSIFTLSSHHPYSLPEHYKKEFSIENSDVNESIKYADWALGKFFNEASKKDWYKNTLFVLVADHAGQPQDPYYKTQTGIFAIPMVFYHPSKEIPEIKKSFSQQLDILPTVLDLINYPDSAFTFGKSLYDDTPPFSAVYRNDMYMLITDDYLLSYDGEELYAIYSIPNDIFLRRNLINKIPEPTDELIFLKALIQTYNNSLIDNKLTLDKLETKN